MDPESKSGGSSAGKPSKPTPESDNGNSGGIAGETDEKGADATRPKGTGSTANTKSDSNTPEAAPLENTQSPPPDSSDSEAPDPSQPESDARNGAAHETTNPRDIEIPILEIDEFTADGTLMEEARVMHEGRRHLLAGVWEQVDGPNTSDFAPGGYQRSVIALNPANKSVSVYRLFRGDVAMVVGGELALDCEAIPKSRTDGTLLIRSDPSLHSKFRTSPLQLGGSPAVTVEPPAGSGPWTFDWKRESVELVLGDKRYTAITREAFEQIRAGGGDVATAADKSERIPARRPGARGMNVKETSFFGVRGGGKRICFIVDMSGSMAGPKFDRLKQELAQSIQGFDETQLFSVVFFDGSARTIDQTWMETKRDSARALQLIAQQGTGGGTDPSTAFEFAFRNLSPLPDCIYFMTDGQIPPGTPLFIDTLNVGKERTIVHTINFGEPASEPVMRDIALQNGGTYTFVQP